MPHCYAVVTGLVFKELEFSTVQLHRSACRSRTALGCRRTLHTPCQRVQPHTPSTQCTPSAVRRTCIVHCTNGKQVNAARGMPHVQLQYLAYRPQSQGTQCIERMLYRPQPQGTQCTERNAACSTAIACCIARSRKECNAPRGMPHVQLQ
jgi:hypothetical protein